MFCEEGPRRVGHLGETAFAHLENADLLRRSEAILGGPQQAQRGEALALEAEHRVHEVLERLGARKAPVLRDVADEHNRRPLPLRELHQP